MTSVSRNTGSNTAAEVRLAAQGSLDNLEIVRRPIPVPGPGQVVIRVGAASLNYRDILIPFGQYQTKPNYGVGQIPLSDGAGTIHAIGSEVDSLVVGQRVTANCVAQWIDGPLRNEYVWQQIGMDTNGWLAEYCVIDASAVLPIPDYLSFEEAATLPCAAVTAATALAAWPSFGPCATVLTLGTGGVSLFALQIAKAAGATVISTTSSSEKAERLKALGADHVINYVEQPDWGQAVREATGGRGVDIVVEIGGATTIANSFRSLGVGGCLAIVGYVGGRTQQFDFNALPPGGSLTRVVIGSRARFETLLGQMEAIQMRPVIDRVFPFEAYRDAYKHLQGRQHVGKVVITMREN